MKTLFKKFAAVGLATSIILAPAYSSLAQTRQLKPYEIQVNTKSDTGSLVVKSSATLLT